MSAILTNISSVVTSAISWISSFVGAIMAEGNELLLLFVIISFVGLGIGLLSRLIHL